MKKIIFLIGLMFIICVSGISFAKGSEYGPKHKRFGAGIVVGEPTGITLKGYPGKYLAVDAIVSWSFVDHAFTIIGDVTYDFFDIPIHTAVATFPFYAGAGAKVGIHSDREHDHVHEHRTRVGIRVPVGVAAQWTQYPVEVYLEVAPGIELAPETEFDISGGLGARFYF